MNPAARQAILVFLRAPEIGKVKTRLARRLGEKATFHLYRQFVLAELDTLARVRAQVKICFHPAGQREGVARWLGAGYDYWPQTGAGLGEKMAAAFQRAFHAGAERAVLIGTDIPDLPARILREALQALRRYPAVLGPSSDGGYYLIGFTREGLVPAVFGHLPWGTARVCAETLGILENSGTPVYRLPTWQDIDDVEDLLAFVRRNAKNGRSGNGLSHLVVIAREAIRCAGGGA